MITKKTRGEKLHKNALVLLIVLLLAMTGINTGCGDETPEDASAGTKGAAALADATSPSAAMPSTPPAVVPVTPPAASSSGALDSSVSSAPDPMDSGSQADASRPGENDGLADVGQSGANGGQAVAGQPGANGGQAVAGQSGANGGQPSGNQSDPNTQIGAPSCTISITCETVWDNSDKLDKGKKEILPKDGIILPEKTVEFALEDSAFDVLLAVTKAEKLHMEHSKTPIYKSSYIEGINNLYEFDCGELSGWMYKVNDAFPQMGSSNYTVQDGDRIVFIYTCDLGRDIGGDWRSQNE